MSGGRIYHVLEKGDTGTVETHFAALAAANDCDPEDYTEVKSFYNLFTGCYVRHRNYPQGDGYVLIIVSLDAQNN